MRRGLCEILSSLEGMNRIGVLKECVHRRRISTISISLNIRECVRRGLCEILSSLEGMKRIGVLKECTQAKEEKSKCHYRYSWI